MNGINQNFMRRLESIFVPLTKLEYDVFRGRLYFASAKELFVVDLNHGKRIACYMVKNSNLLGTLGIYLIFQHSIEPLL